MKTIFMFSNNVKWQQKDKFLWHLLVYVCDANKSPRLQLKEYSVLLYCNFHSNLVKYPLATLIVSQLSRKTTNPYFWLARKIPLTTSGLYSLRMPTGQEQRRRCWIINFDWYRAHFSNKLLQFHMKYIATFKNAIDAIAKWS